MKPKIIFSEGKGDWVKRPLLSNIEKILDYRGRTPKKLGLSWSSTGYLALSALNVKNGYIDFKADANYGDQELYDRWMGDNHLHKGQVVFTTEAPMGNVAQIPNDALYILSQRTIAFEVKRDLIREDFLATLLRSQKIFNELTSLSSGGTAKGVSQKSLSNLKVCLPTSLEEQSAIGTLFRTLDDLLASYKDNLTNYQSLKATMLSKMFTKAGQTVPEIRLDGFEGEWELIKLGEVCDLITKGTTAKSQSEQGKVNFIKVENLKDNEIYSVVKISEEEHLGSLKRSILFEGDILFSIAGTLGRTAIVRNNVLPANTNQALAIIRGYKLDAYFLLVVLSGEVVKDYIRKNPTVGAQPNLSLEQVSSLKIQAPSIEEQRAIGLYFSNLDNLINSYQEKISQLETLKKKLLQDMFI